MVQTSVGREIQAGRPDQAPPSGEYRTTDVAPVQFSHEGGIGASSSCSMSTTAWSVYNVSAGTACGRGNSPI
eukprot:13920251-Alexandrium_andersonii.AAC.1